MDKLKEYNKTNFHQCALCHKEVYSSDDFILTITKGFLKRNFAHIECYNKLLRRKHGNKRN